MRLIKLRWDANPNVEKYPLYIDPDQVAAVARLTDTHTTIILISAAPLLVPIPAEVVVEQLYDGYNATRH